MSSSSIRLNWRTLLVAGVFGLILLNSCKPEGPAPPSAKPDAKEELQRALKGANVNGFTFETREDDAQAVASFTNIAVRKLINLDKTTPSVVLRYTSVKDKARNATKVYKTEAAMAGKTLTITVSDFATGEVVSKDTSAEPPPPGDRGNFKTLQECIDDFFCKHRSELECEANRTCKTQFVGIICCLTNGQCVSVHFGIKPTSFRCQLQDLIPDFEGMVLSP
jgi:hypothetical protein